MLKMKNAILSMLKNSSEMNLSRLQVSRNPPNMSKITSTKRKILGLSPSHTSFISATVF